jgi:hypothetical protein
MSAIPIKRPRTTQANKVREAPVLTVALLVRSRMIGFCIIGDRCSWGERS